MVDGRFSIFFSTSSVDDVEVVVDPALAYSPVLLRKTASPYNGEKYVCNQITTSWTSVSGVFVPTTVERLHVSPGEYHEIQTSVFKWVVVNPLNVRKFNTDLLGLSRGTLIVDSTVSPPAIVEEVGIVLPKRQSYGSKQSFLSRPLGLLLLAFNAFIVMMILVMFVQKTKSRP